MAVVKNLMVRAGADFSAITKQASKASQAMRGMHSSVSRSCDMMSKAAGGLKRAFGAIGVGLSVAALVNLGKEAAAAYDEQAAGEMRLATVMRNTMNASNDEIQSILDLTAAEQKLGIVGDEVQLAGAQQLSTYLSLTSSLETLIPVMNDLAVQQNGFNVTAEETTAVAKMMGKAMEGQVSALTRYGFTVDAAQEKIMKYGTEAERAATLAEIIGSRVGGMNAALAATPTGRMRQLSNAMADIKEQFGAAVRTIGTVFLPILNAVGSVLAGIATMVNKVAQAIANVFGGTVAGKEWQWAGISAGVADTADAMDDLTSAQNSSANAAKKQAEALQTASFDTLNILKATDTSASEGSGGGNGISSGIGAGSSAAKEVETASETAGDSIGWLQQKLEKLKNIWEDFRSKLDFSQMKKAWDSLKDSISKFGSAVESILGAVWEKYLEPLSVWTINKALPAMLETLSKVIGYVAEKVKNLASLIKGDMTFKEWLQTLTPVEKILGAVAVAVIAVTSVTKLFSAALTGLNAASGIASAAILALSTPIGKAVALIAGLVAAGVWLYENWDWLSAAAKSFGQDIVAACDNTVNNIKASINKAKEAVTSGVQNIINSIRNLGQSLLEGFTAPFRNAYNTISGIVQQIRNLLNFSWSIPRPKIPVINWSWNYLYYNNWTIPIPDFRIDWYAKGGVFDQASLIGVGDHGQEAVVPLEHNTGWISKVAGELADRMAGGTGTMNGEALIEGIHDAVYEAMMAVMGTQSRGQVHETKLSVNGREFVRAIYKDLKAVEKEHGVSLINA